MVNAAYARLFGRSSPDELEGEPWGAVLPADELRRLRDRIVQSLQEVDSWRGEATGKDRDGESVPLDLSLTRLEDGRLLCVVRDFTEQRQALKQLEEMAHHDALTGLANRRLLHHRAEQAAALARRHGHEIALLYFDLDDFKAVNDTLGHAEGDQLLEQVGARVRQRIRESDTAARVGGDEFAVLFSEVEGEKAAVRAARRVLDSFRAPFRLGGYEVELSAGGGVALHPRYASDFEELLRQADLAMYGPDRSKESGVRVYRPQEGVVTPWRAGLVDDLHQALRHYRFELHYQPVRGLAEGDLRGAEARIRWPHPRLGHLSAAKFLPLVGEAGLLRRLDRWVLARAAIQLRDWSREGFDGWMAVHLSGATWRNQCMVEDIRDGLAPLDGGEPEQLVVQIPAGPDPDDRKTEVRRQLADLGLGMALNAFGPGSMPLEALRRLKPRMINLDQALVRGLRPDSSAARLLRVTMDVGHTLGAQMVAKGVEHREEQSMLSRAGCDLVQGYRVGWPVPAREFPADAAG